MNRDNESNSCFLENVMTARNAVEPESFLQQQCSNIVERCSFGIVREPIEQFTFFHS